jgi:dTDP-4-amino-4,6-dideoxygalactose transaminase
MGIGIELAGDLELLMTTRALRRKAMFRMTGPSSQCWRAEQEIQQMYPGMRCLLLPSATIGLSLLLELLNLEPGSEVLITPYGWVSNWSCIKRAGLVPRFLPLDHNLQLRAEDVAQRIGARTRAVIVTHLLGRGQQAIGAIGALCAQRDIVLLEDVAQSFGVSVGRRRAGTFGAAAWCSLNHNKLISTGDGGFALVRDEELFTRLTARHDQGLAMRQGKRTEPASLEPGLSLRMPELTAAVLRAQIARFHLLRRKIFALYGAVAGECQSVGLSLVDASVGDIPFTVIFRRTKGGAYPTLADSGWHTAANVPWLAGVFAAAASKDAAIVATMQHLASVSAVGSGYVDGFHAIPEGLVVTEGPDQAWRVVRALERQL